MSRLNRVVEYLAVTHKGRRPEHQDAIVAGGLVGLGDGARLAGEFLLGADERVLFAVVDGMGGYRGGESATAIVAADLARIGAPGSSPVSSWSQFFEDVSDRVGQAGEVWGTPEMGATVAGLVVGTSGVEVFNVGDCRAYQLAGGYLGQLSVDDHDPDAPANVVTQSLGGSPRVLDAHQYAAEHSDEPTTRYLLCSDGVHGAVGGDALRRAAETPSLVEAVTGVVRLAQHASDDNFSVVMIDVNSQVTG